jgi:long-subunit acyl-CoA synthetase (AMP-forming)
VPELFTPDNGLLTANQKLRRNAIEARYRDAIEEMYR